MNSHLTPRIAPPLALPHAPQFDLTEPTSSSGGKARAVQSLMDTHGLRTVLMVGDGATGTRYKQYMHYLHTQLRNVHNNTSMAMKQMDNRDHESKVKKKVCCLTDATCFVYFYMFCLDLEARPPAAAVVGFGGIAARPAVITGADWFVYSLGELEDMAVASYAAGRAERQQKQQQQEEGKVGTAQTEAETAAVATE